MKLPKLGVLISGSNLQVIIDQCASVELPAEVVVVISSRNDAYGLKRANRHGIRAFDLSRNLFSSKSNYNLTILRILQECKVDLVIMAGYMRLLGAEVLDAYVNRIMNLHPAMLPSFPGAHGIRDALEYGAKWTGVTVHFADADYDTGPIILQEPVEILSDDTEDTLAERIHEVEHRLLPQAIKLYCEGKLRVVGRRVIIKD